ncbi:MAG TPA: hypothetical protein VFT26_03525 [Pyrinomonadaceae bacterium]|nr:hypothetical protein [Pyrinomonadaceae bacterium]
MMHVSQSRTPSRAIDFRKTARGKRSLLRGTSSAPGDVASGLAGVPRAAGRAAHIEDTRRANNQQEGVSQRTCRSFEVIQQF